MSENAVIYARYSSHSQNEQSIETQVEICKSYAEKNHLNVVNIYDDKAKTGTNDNREAFQQMLSDSSKKAFKYVIVYNLSRFARNSTESVMNELILNKNGVSVVSATESINGDDDDPIASLMKNIMRGVNEYYSKNTAKNIRDGLRTNAKKGLSIGGFSLPLGYKSNNDKEIIIDEETAPHVKRIFEMYNENCTSAEIVRYLNSHNIKTSRGNEFNKNSIRRIITNPKYIGKYIFKGEEMPVRLPCIVDEKLFNSVQELVERKHISHTRKSDYLLTDKLYCGLCGAKMTGVVAKHRYHYYKCVNSKGGMKTCTKEKVDREFIEDLVLQQTRSILTKDNIKTIADKVMEYIEKDKDMSVIKSLNKSIKNCEKEIANLLTSLKQAPSDNVRNLLLGEIENVQQREKELKTQLLFEEANNMPINASQIRFYLSELKKGSINDIKYKRLLINTFVHKIYLYDDRMIISYTTQDEKNIKNPTKEFMFSSLEGTIAPADSYLIPGTILHIDSDDNYIERCSNYYKKNNIKYYSYNINEEDQPNKVLKLINKHTPNIVIITGHDAYYKKTNTYKNSRYFIDAVKKIREVNKDIIIISGACQSDYLNLVKNGSSFASSPSHINIHALDPSIIAVNIALTDINNTIDIKEILDKTKYGSDGIGGCIIKGTMKTIYPRIKE